MPFGRYTADQDGGFTFYDDETGQQLRAAGPAAAQRARELDYAAMQTPMAQAGLPPVPPRPEQQLLAAAPPAPLEQQIEQRSDAAAVAIEDLPPVGGARPAAPRAGWPRPAPKAAPKPAPDPEVTDLQVGAPPAPAAAPGQAVPPAEAKPAGPPTTPDGRRINFPSQPADAQPPEGPKQLIESGSTTVQSGSGSSSSTSSSFQRSMGPDPKAWQAVGKSTERVAQLQAFIAQKGAEASKEIEAAHQEIAWHKDLEAQHLAAIEAETQEKLAPINDRMMAALDAYQKGEVDPGRIWKNAGTWGQIGAALAVGFGAIAQGLKGGPNEAWNVIQGAIDRDVQLQVAELEKKRGEVSMLGQIGREVLAQGGDRKTAEAAMRATAIQAVQARIQAVAANADAAMGDSGISAKAELMLAASREAFARETAEMTERTRGQVAGQSTRSTQTQSQVSKTHVDRELVDAPGDPNDDKQQIFYNGQYYKLGGFISPNEAEKWRDKFVQLDVMKMNTRKLKELRKEVGQKFFEDARYSVIADQIAAARSQLQGMGVLGEKESQRYDKFLSNLRAGDDVLNQMDDFTDRIAGGVLNQTKARALGSGGGGGVTIVGGKNTKPGGKRH